MGCFVIKNEIKILTNGKIINIEKEDNFENEEIIIINETEEEIDYKNNQELEDKKTKNSNFEFIIK
jgi:hypothetical protein